MDILDHNQSQTPLSNLASPIRLLIFAVLVPAFVAGTNQWIYNAIPSANWLEPWRYPWMIFTTALLSWCTGRYLPSALLRWIVFGWSLALLDFLTLAGRIPDQYGHLLVSSQISLLVIWAVLATVSWQWRLPAALAAAPLVIGFSGAINDRWWGQAWNVSMILATATIALVSAGLRWRGFQLVRSENAAAANDRAALVAANQFGIKHLLVWGTAVVPLLLLFRGGIDYFVLGGVQDIETAFAALAIAASLATVNLIAIWAVLGAGSWVLRMLMLLAIPPMLAGPLVYYSIYLHRMYGNWPNLPILDAIIDMRDHWFVWMWLDGALLASLLLFLRASGYRLLRNKRQDISSS
jgi:hypothetical protein